ncbi:MAG: preprotein translocase subunit SecA [Clostridia bacterium]|nr:preprotein translocase subunit SecA [Clostridia bacterium]
MMGLADKLFGTYSERQVKKLNSLVNKIEDLADKYGNMTDDQLRGVTDELYARLRGGETLDDILPDAFALVREADDRVLGKRPFRVQLVGGILLHQGRIAEMKTGEGKTLVATMPAYLNALSGEGVHIVTVNDYLARRDSEEMGRVYGFLGLTTGLVVHGQTRKDKQAAYSADITYGTNNEFGFDYLRDNMVNYKKDMVQRGHAFAIVDEVDSILIDEARTPLIISGQGEKSTDMYDNVEKFASRLKKFVIKELDDKESHDEIDADYIVDEKARNVTLTKSGVKKAEEFFSVENLSAPENAELFHHINIAIRAHGIMHRDEEYIVKDGQVIIVDSFTGRLMPGRRFSDGLHQAIEAKEKVKIEHETKTLATVTFQNYFRMYTKLSGMTGTALTEDSEFREIYGLDVVEVPTNKPMIRKDHEDSVYRTQRGKYIAIVNQIKECHDRGQPVLVGTVSVEKSEFLSRLLKKEGVEHTVLNAKFHEKEAEIVAQAGKIGAVTISTNMAGRGTDIMLGGNPEFLAKKELKRLEYSDELIAEATGTADTTADEILAVRAVYKELYEKYKAEIAPEAEKVREAGGLFILGTERHESRRIDNQLRGRSGRQGDPGESRFFLSFEDDLMRLFGTDRILGMVERLGLDETTPIDARILSNSIEGAQKRLEGQNFNRRKTVLEYDDVMNQQRKIIYGQRKEVLDGLDLKEKLLSMIATTLEESVAEFTQSEIPDEWNFEGLRNRYAGLLCNEDDFRYDRDQLNDVTRESLSDELTQRAEKLYLEKEELFGEEAMREIERIILLRNVDEKWMDHLDVMDDLRGSIGLHAYAQRNPLSEYRIQGADMFDAMISEIREDTVRMVLSVMPRNVQMQRVAVARATSEGFADAPAEAPAQPAAAPQAPGRPSPAIKGTPIKKEQKVGRNDPCPCGSGKKYKKCCGMNEDDE